MLRCWSALVIASSTCTRRPYFSPTTLNPQRNGAERLRESVARTSLRSPSAARPHAAVSANTSATATKPAAKCRAIFILFLPLFSQAIKLIDRFAGRLGQITEIEIGCDLVAHIRFGEAELWPLPSDVDRSLHVD